MKRRVPLGGQCRAGQGRDRRFWNRTSEVRTAGSRMHNLGLSMLTSRGGWGGLADHGRLDLAASDAEEGRGDEMVAGRVGAGGQLELGRCI
ncbi:hypothetical protein CEP54_003512 [Fusarium duplospermum]|uniref:Uncharacterized protein n=1 Tax=Fusarium duplospermum TaxID=1325734 RepID=A0A428QNS3_9HYPO|nr:hypothetical protein CEP54_003512 [Fusarium duplospermum]